MADSPIACATCGTQIENGRKGRKYCSTQCKNRRPRKRPSGRSRPERILSRTYECWWCGSEYHPKRTEQNKCCSRECGFKWMGFKRRAVSGGLTVRHKAYRFKCVSCGDWHDGIVGQITCSDRCRLNRLAQIAAQKHNASPRDCAECGSSFTPEYGSKRRVFCSDVCRNRNSKRTARKRERALLRQAQVEPVNPIKVFERDGWRCCRCGTRTPRRLRGTYNDRAPEMDHIEPLSQGGEHSYRNTQCLCRKCNAAKSDGAGGQLRLFG